MKTVLMRKLPNAQLECCDEGGKARLDKIANHIVIAVEIKQPRNIIFHAKFMAMLRIVLDNQDHYKSIDDLLDVCKLRVGHFKTIRTKIGDVQIPKSISFGSMDEAEFGDFYGRAVEWVATEVIPGMKAQDLNAEVESRLLGFSH